MGTTTFSGPIKAGTIKETTGTVLGSDVKNTGQTVMSQSIMINAEVAAGTFTHNVGVIPENSQLLSVILRVGVVSNAGGTATVSVGVLSKTTQFLIANTNVKALGETTALATGSLDTADRFTADSQITATLISAGATATTGQITVTFTYLQANNLRDAIVI